MISPYFKKMGETRKPTFEKKWVARLDFQIFPCISQGISPPPPGRDSLLHLAGKIGEFHSLPNLSPDRLKVTNNHPVGWGHVNSPSRAWNLAPPTFFGGFKPANPCNPRCWMYGQVTHIYQQNYPNVDK